MSRLRQRASLNANQPGYLSCRSIGLANSFRRILPTDDERTSQASAKAQRRTAMRQIAIAIIATALLASSTPSFAVPPPKSPQVRGEGCAEPGAEARCFTVNDMKS